MVLTAKLQHYFSWCIWFCHHASCGQSCCVIGFHDVPFTSFLCHAMYIRVVMSWAFMPCHRSHAVLWSAMLSLTCMLSQRGQPCFVMGIRAVSCHARLCSLPVSCWCAVISWTIMLSCQTFPSWHTCHVMWTLMHIDHGHSCCDGDIHVVTWISMLSWLLMLCDLNFRAVSWTLLLSWTFMPWHGHSFCGMCVPVVWRMFMLRHGYPCCVRDVHAKLWTVVQSVMDIILCHEHLCCVMDIMLSWTFVHCHGHWCHHGHWCLVMDIHSVVCVFM